MISFYTYAFELSNREKPALFNSSNLFLLIFINKNQYGCLFLEIRKAIKFKEPDFNTNHRLWPRDFKTIGIYLYLLLLIIFFLIYNISLTIIVKGRLETNSLLWYYDKYTAAIVQLVFLFLANNCLTKRQYTNMDSAENVVRNDAITELWII